MSFCFSRLCLFCRMQFVFCPDFVPFPFLLSRGVFRPNTWIEVHLANLSCLLQLDNNSVSILRLTACGLTWTLQGTLRSGLGPRRTWTQPVGTVLQKETELSMQWLIKMALEPLLQQQHLFSQQQQHLFFRNNNNFSFATPLQQQKLYCMHTF